MAATHRKPDHSQAVFFGPATTKGLNSHCKVTPFPLPKYPHFTAPKNFPPSFQHLRAGQSAFFLAEKGNKE
jgi:hypothetical protein